MTVGQIEGTYQAFKQICHEKLREMEDRVRGQVVVERPGSTTSAAQPAGTTGTITQGATPRGESSLSSTVAVPGPEGKPTGAPDGTSFGVGVAPKEAIKADSSGVLAVKRKEALTKQEKKKGKASRPGSGTDRGATTPTMSTKPEETLVSQETVKPGYVSHIIGINFFIKYVEQYCICICIKLLLNFLHLMKDFPVNFLIFLLINVFYSKQGASQEDRSIRPLQV